MITSPRLGLRSIAVSVSVCLSVRMSQKLHVQTSRNFLYMLIVTMARSLSNDSATILPRNVPCTECSSSFHRLITLLCTFGFVDDFIFAYNRPCKGDADRAYTHGDSPGGSTGDEV